MKVFTKALVLGVAALLGMSAMAQQQATTTGEVRRIDVAKGKIAIKHGAIADFKLPAMTLVYEIPKNLISKVKPGDRVKFTATQANNRYTIDDIEVDN